MEIYMKINCTDRHILRNGVAIPVIGFGSYMMHENTVAQAVKEAIRTGYRLIDCASAYGNEDWVGKGIRDSGVPREQIFITGKVNNPDRGYEKTKASFEKTLRDMELDYLDLYLIHWPAYQNRFPDWEEINLETWRAMTELYREGKIRAIGVSNFKPHHMEALMKTEIPPMVDQIEYHPGNLQMETVRWCRENSILVEAWSPLGKGRVLQDERLGKIADKYGKSIAQICIRYILQTGVLPLPKSATPERIHDNFDVFDFHMDAEDMDAIDSMPAFGGSGLDSDRIDF